jgi:hypothetical protein
MIPSMHNSTKLFLSVVFLTVFTAGANAQSLHIGVKAGANIFNLSGHSFDNKSKFGFNAGAYGELYLTKEWGIQPELLFSQSTAKTTEDFNTQFSGISFQTVSLDYVTLPVLLAFRPSKEFTILAGPQIGYLIYQTQNLTQQNSGRYRKDAFNKADISIAFGGQFNLNKVKLGARYVIGLNNINDLPSKDADQWKNQGFQFYVGFQIL